MAPSDQDTDLLPVGPIRRFDVFAEYSRLERLDKGYPQDEAKGYGIWLAKVVASRRGRSKDDGGSSSHKKKPGPEPKFRSLNDQEQEERGRRQCERAKNRHWRHPSMRQGMQTKDQSNHQRGHQDKTVPIRAPAWPVIERRAR